MEGIVLELDSSGHTPLAAALQRTFPASFNAKQNDCRSQPLHIGIYLMNADSEIQYYDPNLLGTRWGLSTEIQDVPSSSSSVMLANEAAVRTSGEVDCLR